MERLKFYLSNDFLDKKLKTIPSNYYLLGIIIFGFLVRGRQYLTSRSFWLDESFLAINLKTRTFLELLEPLEYSQVAPIGFLWGEKLMATMFGFSELSLRFIPFVSSLIAIYLIFDLSKTLLNKRIALIIAFSFTLPLTIIYFASELKQYMTDIFSGLLLFWFYYKYVSKKENERNLIFLGVLGAIAIWLSNVTPIILISIGLAIFIDLTKRFSVKKAIIVFCAYCMWMVSFLYYYFHFIKDNPDKENMQSYWASSFVPHDVFDGLFFVFDRLFMIFKHTASHYEMALLALLLFFVGAISVFLKKSKMQFAFLLLPILVHLVLSYFKMYPFDGRLVLYLVPIFLIFEIIGIAFIADLFKQSTAVTIFLSMALLMLSFLRVPNTLLNPSMGEDIKPVLSFVSQKMKKGDIIYVYSGSHAAFRFYKENYFSETDNCIVGVSSGDNYEKFGKELEGLHNRVWIVFSHMNPPDGLAFIDEIIDSNRQLDFFQADGAKVYLINKE